MRGKALHDIECACSAGITPAHAGKSHFLAVYFRLIQDHPRACGEKRRVPAHGWRRLGSPPRMRGKDREVPGFVAGEGITPAHAGKRIYVPAKDVIF